MGATDSVLLDTSVVVEHFRGNTACNARLAECEAVCLPAIALGELYHGAYKSAYTAKHLAQIENFLNGVFVLETDGVTARYYGQLRSQLARAGALIPENDIWIGAMAKQYGLSLATRDVHFEAISGIIPPVVILRTSYNR